MADRSQSETALVQFSERLTNSAAFSALFREGMDLVEETAAYLDGAGRTEAKALDRSVSLTYATESMRLTTRLMQLASWLLLHRAVKEGEMTLTQANREKTKVKLSAVAGSDRAFDGAAKQGSPPRHHDSRAPGRTGRNRQSTCAAAQSSEGGFRAIIPAFPAAETSLGAETKTPLTGQGRFRM